MPICLMCAQRNHFITEAPNLSHVECNCLIGVFQVIHCVAEMKYRYSLNASLLQYVQERYIFRHYLLGEQTIAQHHAFARHSTDKLTLPFSY